MLAIQGSDTMHKVAMTHGHNSLGVFLRTVRYRGTGSNPMRSSSRDAVFSAMVAST